MIKGAFDTRILKILYERGKAMKTIGIDIGTTTICAVLVDADSGELLISKTVQNTTMIHSSNAWERLQQPERILYGCIQLLALLLKGATDAVSIGVTGQMHGIIYLDAQKNVVSPLYTW